MLSEIGIAAMATVYFPGDSGKRGRDGRAHTPKDESLRLLRSQRKSESGDSLFRHDIIEFYSAFRYFSGFAANFLMQLLQQNP
jgi:hypothetical protein